MAVQGRDPQSSGQIICSEYFHDFYVYLHKWASSWLDTSRYRNQTPGRGSRRLTGRAQKRKRAVFLAVSGQFRGRLWAASHGRRHGAPFEAHDGTTLINNGQYLGARSYGPKKWGHARQTPPLPSNSNKLLGGPAMTFSAHVHLSIRNLSAVGILLLTSRR